MPANEEAIARANENGDERIAMAHLLGGNYDPDPGDSIRLHRADDSGRASHKIRTIQEDENGLRYIDVPAGFKKGDAVYLLQTKSMSKRYARVLPPDLSKFRRQPGAEILPVLDLTPISRGELSYFPEGLYIQVSTIEDIFIAQSKNPVRIILELTSSVLNNLLEEKTTLPLSKKMVILSLDPFCTPERERVLSDAILKLIDLGFTTFIANNTAHLALLRGKKARVIAGPYLYTFNRWAVSFLENQGIGAFITPLENSWTNLKSTFEERFRDRVLVTVYAYPALFRLRFQLPENYGFTYFRDKEEMEFKVTSNSDGSQIMPEAPFSIADKADSLKKEGFKRILLDFSRTTVSRQELKIVTNSILRSQPIEGSSRFNWKDGFYSPEKIEEYRAMNERQAERRSFEKKERRGTKKKRF